ncbi:MAG TPA: YlmC/YmxH family sporulation protein [Bacillota bacterium]
MDRLSDLGRRDVINIVDGRRLGYVVDLEVEPSEGYIQAIIVPGRPRLFGLFGRERDLVIPWDCIVKIGEDVVLVELSERGGVGRPRKGRHHGREYGNDFS